MRSPPRPAEHRTPHAPSLRHAAGSAVPITVTLTDPQPALAAPRRNLLLLLPLLLILALAFPLLHYQLPNFKSTLTEEYQPFKTLKFLASAGRDFHKWGPVDNFLLAPGYLLTFGWWKLTGQFSRPSSDYPYGLADPLRQISFLILQSRILLLSLGLLATSLYTRALSPLAPRSRAAAPLAVALVIATNPVLVFSLVALKPDAPMIIFSALALAMYVRLLTAGITARRAANFAALAAIAISAKESALPLLALPMLYLLITPFRTRLPNARRIALALLLTFTLTYLAVSVLYAPATWWQRMTFWFGGPGMDAGVWGDSHATWLTLASQKIAGLADNLGPAGLPLTLASIGYLLLARPPRILPLVLPLAGFLAALVKIGYAADYFIHPLSLALAPLVTLALDRLLAANRPARSWKHALVAACLLVNFYYAQITWLLPFQAKEILIERDLANLPANAPFSICTLYRPSAKSRLQALGYDQDLRPLPALVADGPANLPEFLYQADDEAAWLADLPNRPQRARMVRDEANFDYRTFPGLAAWNYHPLRTLSPKLPAWYPFTFMPIATYEGDVRLYQRAPTSTIAHAAPATR
jgi:hypothetical protein